jgi:hypothetical protein
MSLPQEFINLLNLDGFIFFIEGRKGKGKTNLALLIAEICKAFNYRPHIATNIKTESFFVEHITNFPDLEEWLKRKNGKKLFILDESGKHIARMGFMSSQNKSFMDILQLIRHYDGGFIGIAPSQKRIDSGFLNTDILDAQIKKITLTTAKVMDNFIGECYFLNDLPRTSIKHSSKDLAEFSMEKKIDVNKLEECCKFAHYYYIHKSIPRALTAMGLDPHQPEAGKRLLIKHLKHSDNSRFTNPVEDSVSVDSETAP